MAEGNGSGLSLAAECWKNAEDLWGDFKHTDFGKIILPPLLNFEWVFCGADRVKGGPRGMRPGAAHP